MRTIIILMALSIFANGEALTISSTTSLEDSGFLAYALGEFTAAEQLEVRVVVSGSGEALRLLKAGDVDLALVHHPEAELEFLKGEPQAARVPIMASRFIIVGPLGDPCRVKSAKTAAAALAALASGCGKFVSRGDNSGTHGRELQLWQASGISIDERSEDWYLSTGSGMGEALRIAAEIDAYLLIDIATWLNLQKLQKGALLPVFDDPRSAAMLNPYSAISTGLGPGAEAAMKLINWFKSSAGTHLIRGFKLQSLAIFTPLDG